MAGRRAFLQGLASLPLIGSSKALIGSPIAVAEPRTYQLCSAYKTWLQMELRHLAWEMADHNLAERFYGGTRVYRAHALEDTVIFTGIGRVRRFHHTRAEPPSTRAALVLMAIGADWREG